MSTTDETASERADELGEVFEKLRADFPDEVVGKVKQSHGYVDYVGHAAVTDRLLSVDVGWTWEPFALDEYGAPLIERRSLGMRSRRNKSGAEETYELFEWALWGKLTVGGLTKIGVGEVVVYPWTEGPLKKLESDFLKRGAMRFGVALSLWAKDGLESEMSPPEPYTPPPPKITDADKRTISELFDSIADKELRKRAKVDFANQISIPDENGELRRIALSDIPAHLFGTLYDEATQFVRSLVPNDEEQ